MTTNIFNYQYDFLFDEHDGNAGILQKTIEEQSPHVMSAITAVDEKITQGSYPFIEALKDSSALDAIAAVTQAIQWASSYVVIGIGGSDLGGRALQNALEQNVDKQVLFAGDTTDPAAIEKLLDKITLSETVLLVISKSGSTIEPMAVYSYLVSKIKKVVTDWRRHVVCITDKEVGILRKEVDTHGLLSVPIPSEVGGRFSILTAVGLLPAQLMGRDIHQIVRGGLDTASNLEYRKIAQQIATHQFLLFKQGVAVVVCMPYASQLEEFARWFRQLWAESLGKNQTGILPVQARGPADQHSQLQFYAQGTRMLSILFLTISERHDPCSIESSTHSDLAYLVNHSLQEINSIEHLATAQSLRNAGTPSATLEMQSLTDASFGALCMLFELAVVYLAEMLQVNAFDQPGVEESKQLIRNALRERSL